MMRQSQKETINISTLYLLSYNSLQAFGWPLNKSLYYSSHYSILLLNSIAVCLRVKFRKGKRKLRRDGIQSLPFLSQNSSRKKYSFLQCAAFLEVIHGAIGLVPSGALLPLMQWGGRTHFLLAVVAKLDEVQELPSVFITFLAWSISEVIRYSHYAFSCMGNCPSWITYLRYTAFIVLYPIGVGPGEMWLMYQALPIVKKKNTYSDFFSGLPFSYYDFLRVVLLVYPFLWLKLYLHMFKQRRTKLNKHHVKKRA